MCSKVQKLCLGFGIAACLGPAGLSGQTTPGGPLPVGSAGSVSWDDAGPLGRYQARPLRGVDFHNSPRLESLLRAGNLYLSLRDAIALALENNLDVEFQRYGPLIAETDIRRAEAGGVTRGISTAVREGPSGAAAGGGGAQQGGGAEQTAGTSGLGVTGTGAGTGGLTGASGPAVPLLDPSFTGSLGISHLNRPQTNTFITGTNTLSSTSHVGDFGFRQGFLFGGTAFAGMDIAAQESNNRRADVNPFTTGGLAFSYVQPLLRGFGRAVNSRFIRIARNNRHVSDLVFEQQVINTAFAVTRLYWDLVNLRGEVQVQRQTLELSEQLLEQNRHQEQAGTLAPIEVTRTRAELARVRRDLTAAETRLRQQETILKDYLTRGTVDAPELAAVRVIPTDSMRLPLQEPVEPLQDLVEQARRLRPELAQAGIQVDNSRIALQGSKNALRPALDLVATARSNTLFGSVNALPPIGTVLPRTPDPAFLGGGVTGLSQMFGARFPDYAVALQLSVPLYNRAAQADYTRDQLSVRQQEIRAQQLEKQIRVDVVNALIAVEQSRAGYEAAREAHEFQRQSLEAEREKFSVGVSTNFLVIQYQRDLAQAQSAEVAALADYAKARATLDRVTGRLLERNGISIEQAFQGRLPSPPAAVVP
jgi:outer membrane protein